MINHIEEWSVCVIALHHAAFSALLSDIRCLPPNWVQYRLVMTTSAFHLIV